MKPEPGAERLRLADTQAVFIRTDPPFDRSLFSISTLVLDADARGGPLLILNDPRGLRDANEKPLRAELPRVDAEEPW